ncbi:MAG: hypothetical protein PF503_13090 [Desulfobacula sp.]|jgi:hypothetical protein|nr:hypothetical protein [Desulfobacula sp.]
MGQINELSEKTGITERVVFEQPFVIPSLGTGSIDLESAKKVLRLTNNVSKKIRRLF